MAQSSAALLPRLLLCCQPHQSPLPSPRDETLPKSPFFRHVLRGQRVPSTGGQPRSPPSGFIAGGQKERRGEGLRSPCSGCPNLVLGGRFADFPRTSPPWAARGVLGAVPGPCPALCCPGEAVVLAQGARGTEAALSPSSCFPLRSSTGRAAGEEQLCTC